MDPIVKRLKEDYLTCVICFELYNEPKVLSCLHTFCEVCLDTLIQKSLEKKQLLCPICREIMPLTEQSVPGLKTHFAYKDMIEEIIRSRGSPLKETCSFCILHSKEVEATYKCLTCMDLLCEFCAKNRHTYTRQTANHKAVHVRDYLTAKHKEQISHEMPCDQHQERLRFFCQQCSIPICGECALVEHRFHDYVSFAEARDIVKEELKKVLQISKAKQEKRQEIHTTLVSKSEDISTNESFLLDKIDSTYREIESKLKNHRQIVEEEIKRKSRQERKNVDNNIQENLDMQDNLQSSVLFCENMLCKGSDTEVVFFLEEMKSCLLKCPEPMEKEVNISLQRLKIDLDREYNVFQLEDVVLDGNTSGVMTKDVDMPLEIGVKNTVSDEASLKNTNEMKEKKATKQLLTAHIPKCLKMYDLYDRNSMETPSYTCITWIDKTSFALADEHNQTVVLVTTNSRNLRTHSVKDIKAIAKFGDFLGCKIQSGKVTIYSYPDFKLERTFNGAYALTSRSSELIWITKDTIVIFNTTDIQEMKILDENGRRFQFIMPLHACCLPNESFAITDTPAKCLYLLDKKGQISLRYVHSGGVGAVSCDRHNRIYMACYETNGICVINIHGECIKNISLTCILQNPRSISVLSEEGILISSKKNVVLIALEE
ncbi:uncharacterized protein LOC125672112 [Ostrea edulis]|uniref:uncharacterized protein LOC125672112 n=1 Tax=Ostrea edulis TaxID=37623 RepID=UPI0024AF0743|nr:uncharacterized protein LOC125672112 [Ostrea edulis]